MVPAASINRAQDTVKRRGRDNDIFVVFFPACGHFNFCDLQKLKFGGKMQFNAVLLAHPRWTLGGLPSGGRYEWPSREGFRCWHEREPGWYPQHAGGLQAGV